MPGSTAGGPEHRRAIVVGAGIGGICSAIALRRAGWEVVLHERASELREVGSGLTLWVNAMRALDKIGAADVVSEQAAPINRIENRQRTGQWLQTLPIGQLADKYRWPSFGIHRGKLQAALAGLLPGETLRCGSQLTAVDQDGIRVMATFADGTREEADLLIGADGIGSTVRRQLFDTSEPRYSGYSCWRSAARLEHPDLEAGCYTQLYGSGSTFGIFPIGEGHWSWYGTQITGSGGTRHDDDLKGQAIARFPDWFGIVPAVIEASDPTAVVRQDVFDRKPIRTWSRGRVVLLGDAAHPTTPTLGQGACMAIEDSVVLARCLSDGKDVPIALNQYTELRRGRANGIIRAARRHGRLYHGATRGTAVARTVLLGAAPVPVAMLFVDKLMGYGA